MKSLCGADCANCPFQVDCKGCANTGGCPFGKQCFVAKYISVGGMELFQGQIKLFCDEINALEIPGMARVEGLYPLRGSFVNLEYRLPGGQTVKFLDDDSIYLGAQVPCLFGEERCYGVVIGLDFILVSEYGEDGSNPEIVQFRRR